MAKKISTVKKTTKSAAAKKSPVKKKAVKKATVKKAAAKKTAVKKAAAKKIAVKKAAPKKAAVKKTAAKKTAIKKVIAKKVSVEKAEPKKIVAEKIETKKAPVEKVAVNPVVTQQPKSEPKKTFPKKFHVKPVAKGKSEKIKKVKAAPIEKAFADFKIEGPAEELVMNIVDGMKERKAKGIVILNLKNIQNRVSDYFVICEAESNTHVDSIAGSVEEEVKKKTGEKPFHSEGWTNSQWILMDYVNVVAHIFQSEVRQFYNIEGMWADAEITEIKN